MEAAEEAMAGGAASEMSVEHMRCMACAVVLSVTERTRAEHYKSDWHRVNLKRKVSGLAPVSMEEFEERMRVLQTQQAQSEQNERNKKQRNFACAVCSKRFSSHAAYEQHVQSRRHVDKVHELKAAGKEEMLTDTDHQLLSGLALAEEAAEEELETRLEEARPFSACECVFDGHTSDSTEHNLAYMAKAFSFFLPYAEFVLDLEGILSYLGEKVGVGYACICCSREFGSVYAAQAHMVAKSHCKFPPEDEEWMEEFGDWYAFEEEEQDGWEELSGDEAARAMIALEKQQAHDARGTGASDGYEEAVELVLPNGKRVGNMAFKRYYDQKPKPGRSLVHQARLNKVLAEYRALGWHEKPRNEVLEVRAKFERIQKKKSQQLGVKTYYTRKSSLRPDMGVLNSGYRP
ncbi:Cytoplasmic 60S subunit biogenesis factor REI1-like 1 [Porphyridium purpureum]|uniref:Cytoplasmic 60S subunit biogenesis factor REI1-like 1 n=1 Tax=Porphyridium purpureum TaxID=35688 RepID=A0A5J4YQS6_PORPP|nr:Cytoplasmic 60S subunit biogenesis factor REI1-like 1 [Porphyridium purpureum]|eukprot:POR5690..scf236_6